MSHNCEHCNRGLVHWNPSTLKAQWNSATNKLITGSTPREITVTLSGFTDCECTFFNGSYYKATGIGAVINGDWVVPQYAGPGGECIFFKIFTGDFGKSERWNAAGCSGAADETRTYIRFDIEAVLTATGIDFDITVGQTCMVFDGTITYAAGESCADTSEVATIEHTCFGTPGGPEWWYPCGTTGTVSVSL